MGNLQRLGFVQREECVQREDMCKGRKCAEGNHSQREGNGVQRKGYMKRSRSVEWVQEKEKHKR